MSRLPLTATGHAVSRHGATSPRDGHATGYGPIGRPAPAEGALPAGCTAAVAGAALRIATAGNADCVRHAIVTELRKAADARQAFLLEKDHFGRIGVARVSSVSTFDRQSPLVKAMGDVATSLERERRAGTMASCHVDDLADSLTADLETYPFRQLTWLPLTTPAGEVLAGLILTSERPLSGEAEQALSALAPICNLAVRAGIPSINARLRLYRRSVIAAALSGAVLLLACLPVPMTVIASAEIVPESPLVVTAPINGIVEKVHVKPSDRVEAGDLLVTFVSTNLKSDLDLAEQEMAVSGSVYRRTEQAAFSSETARQELLIRQAEMDLKAAQIKRQLELFSRSKLVAAKSGVALFSKEDNLEGQPFQIGHRLMEIAEVDSKSFSIEVHLSDAFLLKDGASVRLFLDRAPLEELTARIVRSSYRSTVGLDGTLVFRGKAELLEPTTPLPIGLRGTALIVGDTVSLGFFLFRRPITFIRQHFGF